MLKPHSTEVRSAIEKLGLTDKVTRHSTFDDWQEKTAKFANPKYSYPLWEQLSKGIAVTYPFAWEWFETILAGKPVKLFFEPDEQDESFVFQDGKDVPVVLNECYRFTFYIIDEQASFLIAYNDHENLFACGTAKKWLLDYLREGDLALKIWEVA